MCLLFCVSSPAALSVYLATFIDIIVITLFRIFKLFFINYIVGKSAIGASVKRIKILFVGVSPGAVRQA
jgi:hypothetical protein